MITLDIIGSMYTPVAIDASGEYISGGEPLPGFHVNAIPAVPGWEAYRVEPTSKRRVFAGMAEQTMCYVFSDEDVFNLACIDAGLAEEIPGL